MKFPAFLPVNPTVPKPNMPLFPLRYLKVRGLAESTLGAYISDICQNAGIVVQADQDPDPNLFIKQGMPALAFKFGYAGGSRGEIAAKNWRKNRYRAPPGDLDQPVDKAAAAANARHRPKWNDNRFFRLFAE